MWPFNTFFVVLPFAVNLLIMIDQFSGIATHKTYENTLDLYKVYGAANQGQTQETRWELYPDWGPFKRWNLFTWSGYFDFISY